jgi:hypothetical protein
MSGVRLLVIHNTEGITRIRDLGNFFGSSSSGVSSHSGSDNYENGVLGAYVDEANAAWTQGNANGAAISIEQCAPGGASADWSRSYWLGSQERLLRNTAMWAAHMSAKYNIPLVALSSSQAQGSGRGVCQHVNLGSWCGNHSNCGPGYPMDQVIAWAKEYAGGGGTSPAPPAEKGLYMTASSARDAAGYLHLACIGADDGKVYYKRGDGPDFYAVDAGQGSARSGADISIGTDQSKTETITITYVNGAGAVCTYAKPVAGGSFVSAGWGGGAK